MKRIRIKSIRMKKSIGIKIIQIKSIRMKRIRIENSIDSTAFKCLFNKTKLKMHPTKQKSSTIG